MCRTISTIAVIAWTMGTFGVFPVVAQQDPVAQCRNITDSLARLTCYDGIPLPDGPNPSELDEFRKISMDDFKVDQKSMRGQRVELQGKLSLFGEMLMLQNGQIDMSPIIVEFSDLRREQRLRIIQRCGMGCNATIQGQVGDVFFQTGIVASSVIVQ